MLFRGFLRYLPHVSETREVQKSSSTKCRKTPPHKIRSGERSGRVAREFDVIGQLPAEIARYIMVYLATNLEQLVRIAQVSSTWRKIANSSVLWKIAFINRWGHLIDGDKLEELHMRNTDWRWLSLRKLRLDMRWANGDAQVRPAIDEVQFGSGTRRAHSGPVYCIKCSEDYMVSGSRDKTAKIWDLKSLSCIRVLSHHTGSVLCLDFDSRYIVTGSSDKLMVIWSFPCGERQSVICGNDDMVINVKLCKDGVVSCSKGGGIVLWDIKTGAAIRNFIGHSSAINSLSIDGEILASGSGDRTIKLWNLKTGDLIRVLKGHLRGISSVIVRGNKVFSGSGDCTVKVWDVSTGNCDYTLFGHRAIVRTLSLSMEYLVTGSYDRTICIWDTSSGKLIKSLNSAHDECIYNVHADYKKIISVGKDGTINVWNFAYDLDLEGVF